MAFVGVIFKGVEFSRRSVKVNYNKLYLHFFGYNIFDENRCVHARLRALAQLGKPCKIGRKLNEDPVRLNRTHYPVYRLPGFEFGCIFLPAAEQLAVRERYHPPLVGRRLDDRFDELPLRKPIPRVGYPRNGYAVYRHQRHYPASDVRKCAERLEMCDPRVYYVAADKIFYVIFIAFALCVPPGENDPPSAVFIGYAVLYLKANAFSHSAYRRNILDRLVFQRINAFVPRYHARVFSKIDVKVVLAVAQYAAPFKNLTGQYVFLDALGSGQIFGPEQLAASFRQVKVVIHICFPSRKFYTSIYVTDGKRITAQKNIPYLCKEFMIMEKKLEQLEERYRALAERLESADVMSDLAEYTKCMKEYKSLSPIIEKYSEYKTAAGDLADAQEIEKDTDDAEMKALAAEQAALSRRTMERCTEELKILLLPKDPNDDKNVIMEIRAGAGGDEAALFAYELYRMYNMYAERCGFRTELLYVNETELKGFKEVSFIISGDGAYSAFKYESGVHRVQRVPETESQGRIHTSTVTVAVLPEVEDVEFQLNMDELEITTHRSAGAGGQHVNKTESAIRIIHIPTGTVVDCQDERSQGKNKEKALRVMKSRLAELERRKRESEISSERRSQVGTGDRSERIRTYNFPQGRVTDHRIGMTLYSLENFLNGDMGALVEALATADRARMLAQSGEG